MQKMTAQRLPVAVDRQAAQHVAGDGNAADRGRGFRMPVQNRPGVDPQAVQPVPGILLGPACGRRVGRYPLMGGTDNLGVFINQGYFQGCRAKIDCQQIHGNLPEQARYRADTSEQDHFSKAAAIKQTVGP